MIKENKTALIIGGSSGIGLATAHQLLERNVRVHVIGRNPDKLDNVRRKTPAITTHKADATVSSQLEHIISKIGKVDWVVIAMGGSKGAGKIDELELDTLRSAFEEKFWGHLTSIKTVLSYLETNSSITLVGAISARTGIPGTSGLAALNGAVESLVKPLAKELAPIRINGVSPGIVDTPWWNGLPDEEKEAYFSQTAEVLPVGHVGQPKNVAKSIVLAATNPDMTGTVIECDGGMRLASMG